MNAIICRVLIEGKGLDSDVHRIYDYFSQTFSQGVVSNEEVLV